LLKGSRAKDFLAEYHCFQEDGVSYCFHVEDMTAYAIPQPLFEELCALKAQPEALAEAHQALLEALHTMNLLLEEPLARREITTPDRVPVATISLNVAQLCNLSCVYCYGGDGEYGEKGFMQQPTAFAAVDWLIRESLDRKDVAIVFFGGEPLLNFPLMKQVVEYALDATSKAGKTLSFGITTNGTKFDDEVNEFLNKYKFSVTISFDGDPAMQDANRPLKGGQGSYNMIRDKVATFLASRGGRATGRATLTNNNTDRATIKQALVDVGFKTIGMTLVSAPETPETTLYQIELPNHDRLRNDLKAQARETLAAIQNRTTIYERSMLGYLEHLITKQKKLYFCGVGRGLLAVSISGDIYPCHRFVGDSTMKMGNINNWDEETAKAAQKPYIENYGLSHPKCSQCFARYFCGGGCIHESLNANGSMWEPDDNHCQELRRSVELAISIYDQCSDTDKEYLAARLQGHHNSAKEAQHTHAVEQTSA
jgi:uncharacterized protein